jgi:hypothetical protein
MEYQDLFSELDNHYQTYESGTITIADDIDFANKALVSQITHYILSKYTDGRPNNEDEIGRRRPFRNIGNAIVDLEWRAKNIDRASIQYDSTDGDYGFALTVNKELQQWMKDNNFGKYIDDHQRKKTEYGSILVKKIEKDGKLELSICKWTYMAFNPRDLAGGTKIEKHQMSPMDLRKMSGVWDGDQIELAVAAHKANRTTGSDMEVWDVEGEFPCYFFDEEERDQTKTALYTVNIGIVNSKKFMFYSNTLTESRFKHFKRKEVEGRDFGVGVWEELFEPQIWTNDASIGQKNALDLGGKVVVKTNMDSDVPSASSLLDGEIIKLEDGEYFDPVSLAPQAMPEFQNVIDAWFVNAQRDQSAFSSMTGEGSKADTPFAAQALQASQAGSIFNKRRDQDGYDLNEILVDWVMPHIVKKIKKAHKLTASYSPRELEWIDGVIKTKHANDAVKSMFQPDAPIVSPVQLAELDEDVTGQLQRHGSLRTIEVEDDYITMEKINTKGRFNITNEMEDGQRRLNALATQLSYMDPSDPQRADIIKAMMEIQGLSPASFTSKETAQPAIQKAAAAKPVKQNQSTIQNALPEGQR